MPSFDVVSEVDAHELANAVDQTNRELGTRFDFKGTDSKVEQADDALTLQAQVEFQLKQIMDILVQKMAKRGIDIACLEPGKVEEATGRARQTIAIKQGIDQPTGKKMIKLIKEQKLKVQASIQGDQLRVSGKKKDDLQSAIQSLREADLGLPLQFTNFRD